MPKYAIAIDIERCTGCYSCFLACKDEHVGNDNLPLSLAQPQKGQKWINPKEIEHGAGTKIKVDYIPVLCQHCKDAPCMNAAPAGAVYRRDDGIVIIDPEKAKGCKGIVDACPYRAVFWNEEANVAQKCTMCAHLLDAGEKKVRCVEVCPAQAMVFGDLDDPNSDISKLMAAKADKVEDFKPEFETKPVVKYLSLPKPFIAGEVILADDQDECLKGAKVALLDADGKVLMETETDFMGDFEFKGLATSVNYTLKVSYEGCYDEEMTVRTNASKNVGLVALRTK
jgi:Fe-S-cluster-containing dehydrogenase component